MKHFRILFLLLLSGCGHSPVNSPLASGIDYKACVGQVPATVQGLATAANDELIAAARGLPHKGGVCAAGVYTVTAALPVYRVYDAKNGNPYGRWWSLTPPRGSRDEYRAGFAICPEWGALDRLISCRLKPGSQIVLGTTQSIQCTATAYPQSADIQVYVPNDSRTQSIYVDNCTQEDAWPSPATLPVVENSRTPADNATATPTGRTP